jgi:hypothetical protein
MGDCVVVRRAGKEAVAKPRPELHEAHRRSGRGGMARRSPIPSRDRHVYAAGTRGRSLVFFGEVSAGVVGCPSAMVAFGGWQATVAADRSPLAAEKSAEAVVPSRGRDSWEGPNAKPSVRTTVLVAVV